MLNKLTVSNFYHFKDSYTLDLKGKKRVLLVGPKGSGKSSLGFALSNPFFYFTYQDDKKDHPQAIVTPNPYDQARLLFQFSAPSGEITYRYGIDYEGGMNTEQVDLGKKTVLYRNMERRDYYTLEGDFENVEPMFLEVAGYFNSAIYAISGYCKSYHGETAKDIDDFMMGLRYVNPLRAKDDRLIEKRLCQHRQHFEAIFEILQSIGYPYDSFRLDKSKIFVHDPEKGDIRFLKEAPKNAIHLLRLFYACFGEYHNVELLYVDDFDEAFDEETAKIALEIVEIFHMKQVIIASKKELDAEKYVTMKLESCSD